jgi:hypothetical protein
MEEVEWLASYLLKALSKQSARMNRVSHTQAILLKMKQNELYVATTFECGSSKGRKKKLATFKEKLSCSASEPILKPYNNSSMSRTLEANDTNTCPPHAASPPAIFSNTQASLQHIFTSNIEKRDAPGNQLVPLRPNIDLPTVGTSYLV